MHKINSVGTYSELIELILMCCSRTEFSISGSTQRSGLGSEFVEPAFWNWALVLNWLFCIIVDPIWKGYKALIHPMITRRDPKTSWPEQTQIKKEHQQLMSHFLHVDARSKMYRNTTKTQRALEPIKWCQFKLPKHCDFQLKWPTMCQMQTSEGGSKWERGRVTQHPTKERENKKLQCYLGQ